MVILECWSQINDRLEEQLEKHTCSSSINKLMRVLKAHWLLPELRAKNCCSTFSFSSTLDQRKSIRANCVCWAGSEAMTCNVLRIFRPFFLPIYLVHVQVIFLTICGYFSWFLRPSTSSNAAAPLAIGRPIIWPSPNLLTIDDHRWPMITINDHHRSSLMDIIF